MNVLELIKNGKEDFYLATTRFTEKTYEENKEWRLKHNWKGCIYSINKYIPKNIPKDNMVFVIEMNNTTNKIMGIGLLRNYVNYDHKVRMYNNEYSHFNNIVYHSNYRKDVEEMNKKELKYIELLELLLFYGKDNSKRLDGISYLKWERLPNEKAIAKFIKFFRQLF